MSKRHVTHACLLVFAVASAGCTRCAFNDNAGVDVGVAPCDTGAVIAPCDAGADVAVDGGGGASTVDASVPCETIPMRSADTPSWSWAQSVDERFFCDRLDVWIPAGAVTTPVQFEGTTLEPVNSSEITLGVSPGSFAPFEVQSAPLIEQLCAVMRAAPGATGVCTVLY